MNNKSLKERKFFNSLIRDRKRWENFSYLITWLVCFACFVTSCHKDDSDVIQLSQTGCFVITNMNSGISQTIIGDESESVRLHVSQGDVLKLQYIPEEQYKGVNYAVNFHLHVGTVIRYIYAPAPSFSVEYTVHDIAPGNYAFTMFALAHGTHIQAYSSAACTLVVVE